MIIENFVMIIAILATTTSILTSAVAYCAYLKKIKEYKPQKTTNNKFVEIDGELLAYIHRIKKHSTVAHHSIVVTDSELDILNKYAKKF